jgi:hypothetical protein
MQTLALDVVEECLQPDSNMNLKEFGFSLLSLLRDRLDNAAKNIEVHMKMILDELPDAKLQNEPGAPSWDPTHCANSSCACELFSIYVAIELKPHVFECFCPECFLNLRGASAEKNLTGYLFCKHEQSRVLNAVKRINDTLQKA